MMDEFQYVPPLFVLLFFGLGASMFASPYLWLYQLNRGETQASLSSDTMMNAVRMLFVVSICSAIYSGMAGANIMGEIIIMTALIVYLTVYNIARKRELIRVYAGECGNTIFVFIITCMFMGLTFVFGFMITKMLMVFNENVIAMFHEPLRYAVFATGLLWIGTLFWLSFKAIKLRPEDDRSVQFHNVLWPLALGLIFVMTPLVLEQMSRDGKLDPEPPRSVLRRA